MKKIIVFISIILIYIPTLKSQQSNQNDWNYGPILGMGVTTHPQDLLHIYVSAGMYGQYSFSKVTKLDIEGIYKFRFRLGDSEMNFLDIPALFIVKLGSWSIGAGLQYSQCLTKPINYLKVSGESMNYLSGMMEFSLESKPDYSGVNAMYYKEQFLSTALRVGYAITPLAYSIGEGTSSLSKYKCNPFFIEWVLKINISSLFNTKKGHTSNRRRTTNNE